MMLMVAKSTRLNLRISEQLRLELQSLADYNGITLSSMSHSLLVRAVRKELADLPEAFRPSARKIQKTRVKHYGELSDEKPAQRRKRA